MNRIFVEKALVILDHSYLKLSFSCEAVQHAIDLHNHTATPELGVTIPTQALLCTVYNSRKLKVFVCAAFAHKDKENRSNTIDGKPRKGVSLGNEHVLHRLYLYESIRVTMSKHVSVDERQFPFMRRPTEHPRVAEQYDEAPEEERTL